MKGMTVEIRYMYSVYMYMCYQCIIETIYSWHTKYVPRAELAETRYMYL